jgi:hypothetical protein
MFKTIRLNIVFIPGGCGELALGAGLPDFSWYSIPKWGKYT